MYLYFFLIFPYFGHIPIPLFRVCGQEGDAVPLAGAVIFCGPGFLMEKGDDAEE